MKIAVSGIGGVGGYFGGLLAKHYTDSPEVEVYFISRGENLRVIRENGLQLNTTHGNYIIRLKLVTDDPAEIGSVDLLMCCTKSYDLEENLQQCKPLIIPQTVIIPLLNGVDSRERILKFYPDNLVCHGCAYIISKVKGPGSVAETGNVRKLFFGSEEGSNERLTKIFSVFKAAGLDATLSENIVSVIWEKFVFISCMATLTSYLNKPIGEILSTPEYSGILDNLLNEVKSVADAKKINLPSDIISRTLTVMRGLPYGTTSSMHADYERGSRTEVESLTGYVVREGEKAGVDVSEFSKLYPQLINRREN